LIADALREFEATYQPADLGEGIHPIAIGLRGDARPVVLAAHPGELAALPATQVPGPTDLRRETTVVSGSCQRRAGPLAILAVVERPPLRTAIEIVLRDD
jgi:hypothetical protein